MESLEGEDEGGIMENLCVIVFGKLLNTKLEKNITWPSFVYPYNMYYGYIHTHTPYRYFGNFIPYNT